MVKEKHRVSLEYISLLESQHKEAEQQIMKKIEQLNTQLQQQKQQIAIYKDKNDSSQRRIQDLI